MDEKNQECERLKALFDSFMPYLFASGRCETFTKRWPHKSPNLTPQKMAEAGFIYSPDRLDDDCVKCPFCLKELNSWEESDDPIQEHKRYQDRCYFARLNKPEEEYTVREVLYLITNTRAALLEKDVFDTLDKVKQSYQLMTEKMERQVQLLRKEKNHDATTTATAKTKKRKLGR